MNTLCSYMAHFFEPYLGKYSVLEDTKQIFVQKNYSSIDQYQKVIFDNYQPRRLSWPVSQIDVQHIMLGFLVEGHIFQQ